MNGPIQYRDDRWRTWLGRKTAWWYHNGPIGQTIRALDNWMWEKARASGDRNSRWHVLRNKLPSTYSGGTKWEWPWTPRSCTCCGGVHPDDALRLFKEGWEIEGTDKGYKAYLAPPGSAAVRQAFLDSMDALRKGEARAKNNVSVWSPVPPVKCYFYHWSQEQIDALRAADLERRARL